MISRRGALMLIAPLALALAAFFLLPILLLVPMSFENYARAAASPRAHGRSPTTRSSSRTITTAR